MGDALAAVLLELRGFTANDFSFIHPGGALGRKLIKVGDLMHTGDELPIVKHNSSFKEMLVEMTSKRFGLAMVIDDDGRLSGIFTDGDLRRAMHEYDDPLKSTAGAMAKSNPKTISAEVFAASAVAIMEDYKITSLVIVDGDRRPIGLIHLHDLLKAKVV